MRVSEILMEAFDDPYPFNADWKEEELDDEDDPRHGQDVPEGLQTVRFTTGDGITYLWYAKENKYDSYTWEIVFGVDNGVEDYRGNTKIDIKRNDLGNQMRVFATVLDITHEFVEYFEDSVHRLTFSASKGDDGDDAPNRARLYKKIANNHVEGFHLTDMSDGGTEINFTMERG